MTAFEIGAILLSLAAAGGYINYRYWHLPPSVGSMLFALLVSLVGLFTDAASWINLGSMGNWVEQIDFTAILLHGMLSLLLFAGALHIDLTDLRQVKLPVAILATIGVVIATFTIGTLVWLFGRLTGLNVSYLVCLLFGALISPTDPIAVLGILKQSNVSKPFYAKIGGESLFNDGVGIVLFLVILNLIQHPEQMHAGIVAKMLIREVVGGLFFGGILGWLAYRILRVVDDYTVEVLGTLALATGAYALAEAVHVSAPITVVVAGLIMGNYGRDAGMSSLTRLHLDIFWDLLDNILNAVLFMLIGLRMMTVELHLQALLLGLGAIAAVLLGRWFSVALPITLMRRVFTFERGSIRLLTWGGLRGGISIALALSLPHGPDKSLIVTITYIVVLFSIVVQGLTFKKFLRYVMREESGAEKIDAL